jgi:asparagine synthase (glutamine-hydrolysing)
MCGIVGVFSTQDKFPTLVGALPAMTDSLQHRGPDDHGQWVDESSGIALGHRRLAIIDLSPHGRQPMASASGRYRIVFNGEVYNFRELRQRLEALGHQFVGHSDTEVMLDAVETWGLVEAIEQFIGMFSFALWDAERQRLHVVRDRLGIKPLYYSLHGNALLFGSELKALRAAPGFDTSVDRVSVALMLKHGYIPGSRTIYKSTKKLPPASILTIDTARLAAGSPHIEQYWSVPYGEARPMGTVDTAEALSELDNQVRTAVADRLVADVPLGAFLSGGIDSSLVVAAMQSQCPRPVKTFSIGFSESSFDEAPFAKDVARHIGTDHTELYVTPKEAQEVIPLLPKMFDEPFADVSQIPTYLVSQLARQSVTVSLSGDGGDELFFGYTKYTQALRWYERLQVAPRWLRTAVGLPLRRVVQPGRRQGLIRSKPEILAELLSRDSDEALFDYFASLWKYPEHIVHGMNAPPPPLVEPPKGLSGFAESMCYTDLLSYLPEDILTKLDRTSMAVSLEGRVPLLDHRVVEFAARLPLELKLRDGVSKWALRQVLYKYVPPEIVDRPKMGFGVPIGAWLKGSLRDWAEELLDENRLRSEGYLDEKAVRTVWREHLDGRFDWQYPLWHLLMFLAWLRADL